MDESFLYESLINSAQLNSHVNKDYIENSLNKSLHRPKRKMRLHNKYSISINGYIFNIKCKMN